jgi:hypothetical protein
MKKRGIVIGILMSLLAGFILGASAGFFLFPKLLPPPPPSGHGPKEMTGGTPPLPAEAVREKIMKRLDEKLELTPEQRIKVEKEVRGFAEELDKFHNANREELKSKFDGFITKLSQLIPEEKIERLRKISGLGDEPPPNNRPPRGKDEQRQPPEER